MEKETEFIQIEEINLAASTATNSSTTLSKLHTAINDNDQKTLVELLESTDCKFIIEDRKNSQNLTPLLQAISIGNFQAALKLIDFGANLEATDENGHTPLLLCAKNNSLILFHYLVCKKANLLAQDNFGNNALHIAVLYHNLPIVRYLASLDKEIFDINLQTKTKYYSALHLAVAEANLDIVKELLLLGIDDTLKNDKDLTAEEIIPNNTKLKEVFTNLHGQRIASNFAFTPLLFEPILLILISISPFYIWFPFLLGFSYFVWKIRDFVFNSISPFAPYHIFAIIAIGILTVFPFIFAYPVQFIYIHFLSSMIAGSIFFFLKKTMKDPGSIPKHNNKTEEPPSFFFSLKDYNFCASCKIIRPLRSKHCSICQQCVARFDHHCIWLSHCIAWKNQRAFFFFLLSTITGIIFWFLEAFIYLSAEMSSKFPSIGANFHGFFGFVRFLIKYHPLIFVVGIYLFIHLCFLFVIISEQIHNITKNTTTNESLNCEKHQDLKIRYKQLFDKGTKENILIFFGFRQDLNWFDLNFHLLDY